MAPPTWHLKASLFETIYSYWKEVMFGGGRGLVEDGYPPTRAAPLNIRVCLYIRLPLYIRRFPLYATWHRKRHLWFHIPFSRTRADSPPLTSIPHGWTKSAITFLNTLWVKQLCRVCECCSSANSIILNNPRMKLVWGFRGACRFLFFGKNMN